MKLFAATLAAACVLAGAASAEDTRVAFRDLDLTAASGAAALDARIDAAARDACRGVHRPASRLSDRTFCTAAFKAEAIRKLPPRAQYDYALARLPVVAL